MLLHNKYKVVVVVCISKKTNTLKLREHANAMAYEMIQCIRNEMCFRFSILIVNRLKNNSLKKSC